MFAPIISAMTTAPRPTSSVELWIVALSPEFKRPTSRSDAKAVRYADA